MRHRIGHKRLNRTESHRKAMLANMAISLIMYEQIKTTLPKAKVLRPYVEKLITIAKKRNLYARRLLISKIKSNEAASKLIDIFANRFETRFGGYIRILKAELRYGDMAKMAYIEFVDNNTKEN